ncbi:protocadherin Fat 4-like isoform X2 [Stylophora pistillata]|uniref:protocadherin Fat 4-like isoform X2 n=1 Tax=Stylophora pistillata TaxID=50429 RepID=UPI000C04DFC8|nr:protocadherin Fat 4-like isoform X2 [Stylophora pistillata]
MFSVYIYVFLLEICSITPRRVTSKEINVLDDKGTNQRERLFTVHEFHYLNVLQVGAPMVYDDLDCTFKCLHHPSCISVNLAAEGGLWCELLSSDKDSNPEEFRQNKSSHHYYIISPCSNNPCHNGGTCVAFNDEETFKCVCKSGFIGEHCERDIDECSAGKHNCSAKAVCSNNKGSYCCNCKSGYSGDGRTCEDFDECSTTETQNCSADAVCSNTRGSYKCFCKPGYFGDGWTCEDVNECSAGKHDCSADAECNNTKGSYHCTCKPGYSGDGRTCNVSTCKEIHAKNISNVSGIVTLYHDSNPVSVYCHMTNFGCGDGGWTPVMKTDGNKVTFHYNSSHWISKSAYNLPGGETGFDSHETKLPTYWNTPFEKICLGMKTDNQTRFIVINRKAVSLHSLIADGKYRNTSLGLNTWKSLIASNASLQTSCVREGFNAVCGNQKASKARIGIIGNDKEACSDCDSRIGFGTGGFQDDSNTCGNEATYHSDNGSKHIKAMGYILVQ